MDYINKKRSFLLTINFYIFEFQSFYYEKTVHVFGYSLDDVY
jgi:hypothetical protein